MSESVGNLKFWCTCLYRAEDNPTHSTAPCTTLISVLVASSNSLSKCVKLLAEFFSPHVSAVSARLDAFF